MDEINVRWKHLSTSPIVHFVSFNYTEMRLTGQFFFSRTSTLSSFSPDAFETVIFIFCNLYYFIFSYIASCNFYIDSMHIELDVELVDTRISNQSRFIVVLFLKLIAHNTSVPAGSFPSSTISFSLTHPFIIHHSGHIQLLNIPQTWKFHRPLLDQQRLLSSSHKRHLLDGQYRERNSAHNETQNKIHRTYKLIHSIFITDLGKWHNIVWIKLRSIT